MKIYVAGSSKEIDLIESMIARLKSAGHTITEDWTVHVRRCMAEGKRDSDLSETQMATHADRDLQGILDAEMFWLLAPNESSKGCWAELGFALSSDKYIVVSGDHRQSIFCQLAEITFSEHEHAFAFIVDAAKDLEPGP